MFILVTGGAGSGKSEFAENKTLLFDANPLYIAAMEPSGSEAARRIERHRAARAGKGFKTAERYTDIKNLDVGGTALLECISNLLANEMFSPTGSPERAAKEVIEGVRALCGRCANLVAVTNETSCAGRDYGEGTLSYMKALGYVNAVLAKKADEVYEVCASAAIRIK